MAQNTNGVDVRGPVKLESDPHAAVAGPDPAAVAHGKAVSRDKERQAVAPLQRDAEAPIGAADVVLARRRQGQILAEENRVHGGVAEAVQAEKAPAHRGLHAFAGVCSTRGTGTGA